MLVWSASLPHTPVDVRLGAFKLVQQHYVSTGETKDCFCLARELQGVLVTVSEVGMCLCSYLGTDPTALSPVLPVSPHYDAQVTRPECGCSLPSLNDLTSLYCRLVKQSSASYNLSSMLLVSSVIVYK